ncbi:MAG TPA: tripartite tricarboxylate transporter substrate binding protein [Burkholderiaceae bacterium]|jgi:tripartite-type tricarboxylate transporter receptor subunit TctC|nr:tripartite tricarboxylate transporter substrate binding protein [Burkholderiaceae bacterium]
MRSIARVIATIAAWTGIVVSSTAALAQSEYPNKPIRLIVGFAPGGSTDIIARIVAQKLGERLGQTIVVENRAGAGGTIGADATAKAPPDGYTLTLGTTSTHAIAAGAYSKLPYNPVTDFTPISLVAITPYLLVVNPQVPARNLNEFLALAKSQPGKLNYASAGNGTATHLAMEMLKDAAKVDVVHIPYKGNAPADTAILAGEVQAVFGSMPALLQNAKANKVRPLAVGTATRSPALPDVPTVAEQGYPGFEAALWLGIMGPANMPKPVAERLHREIVAIVATPEFKASMDANGAEPISSKSPEEFREMLRGQVDKYGKITKAIGIKLD